MGRGFEKGVLIGVLVRIVLAFALALVVVPIAPRVARATQVATTMVDNVVYRLMSDGTASVARQDEAGGHPAGDVAVAEHVELDGATYTVVALDEFSFSQCEDISSITIPLSVTLVGSYSFWGCPKLTKIEFEYPDASTPALKFSTSALATSTQSAVLTSFVLPARSISISSKMFQNQCKLAEVDVRPEYLSSIGAYAFDSCSALKEIRIPQLSDVEVPLGTRAFLGCDVLETVVFAGDVNYEADASQFSSSAMKETYSLVPLSIKNIVYYGSTVSVLFPDAGNHYYRVAFYASEQDYRDSASPQSYACLREGTKLMQISSVLEEDAVNKELIFEGEVPSLPAGQGWVFPGHAKDEGLQSCLAAYPADDYDLSNAEIIGTKSYPYIAQAVSLDFDVRTAGGAILERGVDYELYVENANGVSVGVAHVVEAGTYTVRAVAASGSLFTGQVSSTFTISNDPVVIRRLSSSASVVEAACPDRQVDTIVLVSEKGGSHTFAASGLAGAFDAPILTTPQKRLSVAAKTVLRKVKPSRVLVVGPKSSLSATIIKQVKAALPSKTSVTRLSGSTGIKTALALYTRTKSAGVWNNSKTCILTSSKDDVNALAVSAYAHASASPVFLVDSKKGIDASTKSAIKKGGFKTVVMVGSSKQVPNSVKKVLGKRFSYKRLNGSTSYALSRAIASYGISKHVMSYDDAVVTGENAGALGMSAASLAGMNGSVMVFAKKGAKGSDACLALLKSNRYSIFTTFIVGNTSVVSSATASQLKSTLVK